MELIHYYTEVSDQVPCSGISRSRYVVSAVSIYFSYSS